MFSDLLSTIHLFLLINHPFIHNLPRTRLYIETNPIQVGDKLIGFQAKYYSDSVSMSGKENELSDAVKGAARAYPGITTLYFYISQEFSPSSKKDIVKPAYQTNIENTAQLLGITIEWRGLSNIEAQLMQDKRLTICRNVFFQADSAVQECCENLKKHKEDAELTALNQEAFEQKIWDEIIRNNRKRKNNLPTRRENTLVFITKEI